MYRLRSSFPSRSTTTTPTRKPPRPLFQNPPDWPLVTPRMLLSHTAGLLNFAFLEPDKKLHLHSKPGASFNYSGEGINLVQFLVEQKKQQPLDQLMQDALFTPLEMKRTGMTYRQEFEADVADRFDLNGTFH